MWLEETAKDGVFIAFHLPIRGTDIVNLRLLLSYIQGLSVGELLAMFCNPRFDHCYAFGTLQV